MSIADPSPVAGPEQPPARVYSRSIAVQASDLLPLFDFAGLLVAGLLSLFAYQVFFTAAAAQPAGSGTLQGLVWVAACVAPFILHDRRFGTWASSADYSALVHGFAGRLLLFLGVIGTIAFAGRWFDDAPPGWLCLWLAGALLSTVVNRVLLARTLRRVALSGTTDRRRPARMIGHVGHGLPVTLLADRPIKRWSALSKAGVDFVLGFVIALLLLPLLAGIALAIKLDSRGPVLFTQRRHGFKNREFTIYKFRTMRVAPPSADAALQQTVRGDSRITRVGRLLRNTSLDELPQIFNVLEGSMSLVGPRPHAINMRTEALLGPEITEFYSHRHRVRPGITGWSQVNGARGATDTVAQLRRRVELDLYYVEHWSLFLDFRILTLTFKEVLRMTNAY